MVTRLDSDPLVTASANTEASEPAPTVSDVLEAVESVNLDAIGSDPVTFDPRDITLTINGQAYNGFASIQQAVDAAPRYGSIDINVNPMVQSVPVANPLNDLTDSIRYAMGPVFNVNRNYIAVDLGPNLPSMVTTNSYTEVRDVCLDHELWLKSNGKEGKKAVFTHLPPETGFYLRNLEQAEFIGCNLDHAGFKCAKLKSAIFKDCTFYYTDFSKADLSNVDFNGQDVSKAIFRQAKLFNTKFK